MANKKQELIGKTSPIGVRFRKDVLASMKRNKIADGPQQALIYLEKMYMEEPIEDVATNVATKSKKEKLPSGVKEVITIPKKAMESAYLLQRRLSKTKNKAS